MKRQRPAESRDPTAPALLPIFSMKKYTPIVMGISIIANRNCVRCKLSPNPVIFRLIP